MGSGWSHEEEVKEWAMSIHPVKVVLGKGKWHDS